MVEAAEALQQANMRIVQGLSPLYLAELGLSGTIEALSRDTDQQAPRLRIRSRLEGPFDVLDNLLLQTVYRLIQETSPMCSGTPERGGCRVTIEEG